MSSLDPGKLLSKMWEIWVQTSFYYNIRGAAPKQSHTSEVKRTVEGYISNQCGIPCITSFNYLLPTIQ